MGCVSVPPRPKAVRPYHFRGGHHHPLSRTLSRDFPALLGSTQASQFGVLSLTELLVLGSLIRFSPEWLASRQLGRQAIPSCSSLHRHFAAATQTALEAEDPRQTGDRQHVKGFQGQIQSIAVNLTTMPSLTPPKPTATVEQYSMISCVPPIPGPRGIARYKESMTKLDPDSPNDAIKDVNRVTNQLEQRNHTPTLGEHVQRAGFQRLRWRYLRVPTHDSA